ncbi:hypothetical protein M3Y94_00206000 [Aphelenchoides besseyi]|nr:hypothetical protein M3Y94_00206000 [Aphelenchoides besseyi]KAI6236668.1 hypothetical protein M3Y95_00182000 [Aphelenchoides besseyi]
MTNFVDVTILAYAAVVFNGIFILSASAVVGALMYIVKRQSLPELSKMAALLPNISESLNYADVPIAVTAIIGSHMQIPLEEIAAEYAKDALQRKTIVINTFRKDVVTDTFLNSYQSKFMLEGYAGEQMLAAR